MPPGETTGIDRRDAMRAHKEHPQHVNGPKTAQNAAQGNAVAGVMDQKKCTAAQPPGGICSHTA